MLGKSKALILTQKGTCILTLTLLHGNNFWAMKKIVEIIVIDKKKGQILGNLLLFLHLHFFFLGS